MNRAVRIFQDDERNERYEHDCRYEETELFGLGCSQTGGGGAGGGHAFAGAAIRARGGVTPDRRIHLPCRAVFLHCVGIPEFPSGAWRP